MGEFVLKCIQERVSFGYNPFKTTGKGTCRLLKNSHIQISGVTCLDHRGAAGGQVRLQKLQLHNSISSRGR